MNECLISVIMPVYNTDVVYLNEAVKSILEQTHKNVELIIIDDHSKNNLFQSDIFKDNRIKLIKNTKNIGPSASRNIALKISTGKYIAIMDSDDISANDRLEKQCNYLENHPDCVMCGSWYKCFGSSQREVKIDISDFDYYKCCLFFENKPTILHSSAMFRAETLRKNGIFYNEKLIYGEDYTMWIRLSNLGFFHIIKDFLIFYRTHDKQLSFSSTNLEIKRNCRISIKNWTVDFLSWNQYLNNEDILNISYPFERSQKPLSILKTLRLLKKINRKEKKFDIKKFEKRINLVWKEKIQEVNNPIAIFFLSLLYPKTAVIKISQLFRKLFCSNKSGN